MIKWHDAIDLLSAYAKRKITTQIRSVSFIVIYLLIFQTTILNLPIQELPNILFGIMLVVLGLALFMEGLVLGVMPIGESLGLKLPSRAHLSLILSFALILGLGATYAEPAIGILRAMGESVSETQAPLLHFILNYKSQELIIAVGIGVGIAVIFGVLRILFDWSLKPLIYPLVIILIIISSYALINPEFAQILGLAWDCGAVTTGPVTVPLVIALGLGISRVVKGHTEEGTSSGFGVVTLASLFPIISVLILSFYYQQNLSTLKTNQTQEIEIKSNQELKESKEEIVKNKSFDVLKYSFKIASQAILPLCLFMFIIYRVFLREKFMYLDEITLGVIFSLLGMTLFNIGIESGLGRLGKQVGNMLPVAYSSIQLEDQKVTLQDFNKSEILSEYYISGKREYFFYLNKDGTQLRVPFHEEYYNEESKSYTYIPEYGPLWGEDKFNIVGIIIVLFFAFLMGYGATLAEPALNTLGATVEDISVGTFKKSTLIQAVAIGVGVGITIGISKIIWNLPLYWLLIPPYLLLLILTYYSSEEFVNIGWDSAGVTTGPVTVPLVLAIGLGIGSQSAAIEGFGILAMASVCPIISVLSMGLIIKKKREKYITKAEKEDLEDKSEKIEVSD